MSAAKPDVLVVGAGPAGLAAALAARRAGGSVVLLDAAADVGGQFWRHLPPERPAERERLLHHGWERFTALRRALVEDPQCEVVTNGQVWMVERRGGGVPRVHVLEGPADGMDRRRRVFEPGALILATGAAERTLPFPGWDLPGVYTAGAAQALAKSERVAVGRNVLVAGAGPFLLPVAASLLRTGARVAGVLEASRWSRIARGWGARPDDLRRKGPELAGYVRDLARNRVPYRTGSAVVAAHGTDRVEAVTTVRLALDWSPIAGTERRISVDAVCVSHGFVPRAELAVAAGCRTGPDGSVTVDRLGRTTVDGVFAAGELTGVGGSDLALAEGTIAGTAAAGGTPTEGARRARAIHLRFKARLEAAHGIGPGWKQWLTGDTVVCRCEDVTVGDIRGTAAATESRGLRSLKLSTRAGLGPCQGRVCGRTVEELLQGQGLLDGGRTGNRPIAALVRLGELADLEDEE
ncbi:NAD(P)/FAD-dependent oxidoreductase [Actinoplanes sp. NPDC051343]|uniref:NAD(P)/FAD-dependent oxidoreductase n=1 Tax=Actinoplanes sp. NPDC051343 TaxID=3363906 RepID=UPI0037AFFE7B